MADDFTPVGNYSVLIEKAVQQFWPLNPDTLDLVTAADEAYVAPKTSTATDFNTMVLPPQFGVFDILIEFSKDELKKCVDPIYLRKKRKDPKTGKDKPTEDNPPNDKDSLAQEFYTLLMGKPTHEKMWLVMDDKRHCRICFAVYIPRDKDFFEGKLKLEVTRRDKGHPYKAMEIDLPLKAMKYKAIKDRVDNLFIFFVACPVGQLHGAKPTALKEYCWFQMKVVEQCDPAQPVKMALVKTKVLREKSAFTEINRRTFLLSDDDGFVSHSRRNVVGLPVEWPILFNSELNGYVERGHMCRFREADIKHNLSPIQAPDMRLMKTANVDLSAYSILLDPGHAIVYNYDQRRSQEWFVAHRVAESIRNLLVGYKMPANHIYWTRTAGFALIEPTAAAIRSQHAPEEGSVDLPGMGNPNPRYVFDLPNRRIRFRHDSRPLKLLSDLLLTVHEQPTLVQRNYTPQPVAVADRQRLVDINGQALRTIENRINLPPPVHPPHVHPPHVHPPPVPLQRVQAGSMRWDTNAQDYLYTLERVPADPNDPPVVVNDHVRLTVNQTDWFRVDDTMLRVLAERTACWSLESEIGGGAGFITAARNAMISAGAFNYMVDQILHSLDPQSPQAWLNRGIKGWHPYQRVAYINETACNLYLTLHQNASGNQIGGFALVAYQGAVPADQVRIGKVFLKYIDFFDQGVNDEGVRREYSELYMVNPSPPDPNAPVNSKLAQYAYLESEFMDSDDRSNPGHFQYERMVSDEKVNELAREIVNAVIDWLLDKRNEDMDPIIFRNHLPPLW